MSQSPGSFITPDIRQQRQLEVALSAAAAVDITSYRLKGEQPAAEL
jgi:hypothetical protein